MKKNIKYFLIFLGLLVLGFIGYFLIILFKNGIGPGLADYEYKVANICHLSSSSVYDVTVYCDGIDSYIKPEIFNLGWDNNDLIAMTHPITKPAPNNPNCLDCAPDELITYWWIQDLVHKQGYGPLSEEEFNKKKSELGVGDIQLMSVEQAKEKGVWVYGDFRN